MGEATKPDWDQSLHMEGLSSCLPPPPWSRVVAGVSTHHVGQMGVGTSSLDLTRASLFPASRERPLCWLWALCPCTPCQLWSDGRSDPSWSSGESQPSDESKRLPTSSHSSDPSPRKGGSPGTNVTPGHSPGVGGGPSQARRKFSSSVATPWGSYSPAVRTQAARSLPKTENAASSGSLGFCSP